MAWDRADLIDGSYCRACCFRHRINGGAIGANATNPAKLMFIREANTGHEFTDSMWSNVIKWFKKHL